VERSAGDTHRGEELHAICSKARLGAAEKLTTAPVTPSPETILSVLSTSRQHFVNYWASDHLIEALQLLMTLSGIYVSRGDILEE
jgi:hypothetical protein